MNEHMVFFVDDNKIVVFIGSALLGWFLVMANGIIWMKSFPSYATTSFLSNVSA